ncbi:hypothetical protein [Ramlibacter algicola]|uniref:Uncharacterized protein n=1 Tax=Ramlibacter algicola TaxID=2795217 RepID=A0A934Q5S3_9BURK|nr:hypothetical protein [Ramlibacter algicola]MBK0394707.1 hypothetical protein [Ramlibacter algicola]
MSETATAYATALWIAILLALMLLPRRWLAEHTSSVVASLLIAGALGTVLVAVLAEATDHP